MINKFGVNHTSTLITPADSPEDKAAIIIQKYIRGYLARKPFLPRSLFPQYFAQCEKANGPESSSIPQALGGKTRVYLPKKMPEVVLKNSGQEDAIKRFHQMQEVRSILDSQNSTHLIIPKARLCGNFLVEQRLPIKVDSYHNMELYLSRPQIFDEAVREMTRLFSKVYLSDLVGYQIIPLGHIADVEDFVRYDNLPFFIVENEGKKLGKIGLIDLEHIQNGPTSESLEVLVRIFPYHLDIIKEEAEKLHMEIDNASLENAAKRGKKYLQAGFADHLKWLKQKDISTETPPQPFEVNKERITKLKVLVEEELLKLNRGENNHYKRIGYQFTPLKNFFIEDPKKAAKEHAECIVLKIIANIKSQIEKQQEEKNKKPISESELVSFRSLIIKRLKLYEGVDKLIKISPNAQFNIDFWEICEAKNISEQLIYVVIQELVNGGELFFFDPAYYTNAHCLCWLRY